MNDGTMTTGRVSRIIAAESARLAHVVVRVNGRDMRDDMTETFDSAAGEFARGKYSREEFQGITGALIEDAWALITEQDRNAAGHATGKPKNGKRAPWATMPTDGSGWYSRIDRVIFWAIVIGMVLALAWVAGLLADQARGESTPAAPAPISSAERDQELIILGGGMSWEAFTECGNGPAACDAVLRKLNANPYGVRVFEDGSLAEAERAGDSLPVDTFGVTYGN